MTLVKDRSEDVVQIGSGQPKADKIDTTSTPTPIDATVLRVKLGETKILEIELTDADHYQAALRMLNAIVRTGLQPFVTIGEQAKSWNTNLVEVSTVQVEGEECILNLTPANLNNTRLRGVLVHALVDHVEHGLAHGTWQMKPGTAYNRFRLVHGGNNEGPIDHQLVSLVANRVLIDLVPTVEIRVYKLPRSVAAIPNQEVITSTSITGN